MLVKPILKIPNYALREYIEDGWLFELFLFGCTQNAHSWHDMILRRLWSSPNQQRQKGQAALANHNHCLKMVTPSDHRELTILWLWIPTLLKIPMSHFVPLCKFTLYEQNGILRNGASASQIRVPAGARLGNAGGSHVWFQDVIATNCKYGSLLKLLSVHFRTNVRGTPMWVFNPYYTPNYSILTFQVGLVLWD